jgi:hypothetical protein
VTDQVQTSARHRIQATVRSAVAQIRRWFDPPVEGDAHPLEVREAILEQFERHVVATGDGRRALAHNHATVTLLAPEGHARERLKLTLADLDPIARRRLGELRCPVPVGFAVTVRYVTAPGDGWTAGQHLDVSFETNVAPPFTDGVVAAPPLDLTPVRGETTLSTYRFMQPRILIGRTPTPIDHAGRPRRNDVVFADSGTEENATVGRAHATIRFDAGRQQYRLFDDGSHNGTRIVREGVTIEVPPRNPVGIVLLAGDEIHLGTAILRVDLG